MALLEKIAQYNLTTDLYGKKILLGSDEHGEPVILDMYSQWSSIMVAGLPNSGKTSSVAWICTMAALADTQLCILDPHGTAEQGLINKINPLSYLFAQPAVDFSDEEEGLPLALDFFEQMRAEFKRRKALKPGELCYEHSRIYIIDEYNGFLDALALYDSGVKPEKRVLQNTIINIRSVIKGGRKFGMYIMLIAHDVNVNATGQGVRNAVANRIGMSLDRLQMATLLDIKDKTPPAVELEKHLRAPLGKGQSIMRLDNKMRRVHFSYMDRDICEKAVRMMNGIRARSEHSHYSQPEAPKRGVYSSGEASQGIEGEERGIGRERKERVVESEAERNEERGERGQEEQEEGANKANNGGNGKRKKEQWEIEQFCIRRKIKQSEWDEVVKVGERMIREEGCVPRTKVRDELGWDSTKYSKKIQPIADWLEWPKGRCGGVIGNRSKAWREKLEEAGWKCRKCGKGPPEVELEMDHVEPKSRGGSVKDIENLEPLCKRCNGKKSNTWPFSRERRSEQVVSRR